MRIARPSLIAYLGYSQETGGYALPKCTLDKHASSNAAYSRATYSRATYSHSAH